MTHEDKVSIANGPPIARDGTADLLPEIENNTHSLILCSHCSTENSQLSVFPCCHYPVR